MIGKIIKEANDYIRAMKEPLPLGEECKITVNFGKGIKRVYTIVNDPRIKGIRDGKHYQIEFCHPDFGEVFLARKL